MKPLGLKNSTADQRMNSGAKWRADTKIDFVATSSHRNIKSKNKHYLDRKVDPSAFMVHTPFKLANIIPLKLINDL